MRFSWIWRWRIRRRSTLAAGARLEINNTLDFTNATAGNRTLSGYGCRPREYQQQYRSRRLPMPLVTVNGGHVGGNGRINGRLTNTGGNVIARHQRRHAHGGRKLSTERRRHAQDRAGRHRGGAVRPVTDRRRPLTAPFSTGILDVSLVNGFMPAMGNTFDVLTAAGGINNVGVISLHEFRRAVLQPGRHR